MSIRDSVSITCDGCGLELEVKCKPRLPEWVDWRDSAKEQAVWRSYRDDWTRACPPNTWAQDYCPSCWAKMVSALGARMEVRDVIEVGSDGGRGLRRGRARAAGGAAGE